MPEYLAPGVYVEETSFRAKTIEGVSTSTAGFIGPTRTGPISGYPELLTSFADFARYYGSLEDLEFGGKLTTNYLAHGVRAFFVEGGKRCYVMRVFNAGGAGDFAALEQCHAKSDLIAAGANQCRLIARFPGKDGNMRVTLRLGLGSNVINSITTGTPPQKTPFLSRVKAGDIVVEKELDKPAAKGNLKNFYIVGGEGTTKNPLQLKKTSDLTVVALNTVAANEIRPLSVEVEIERLLSDGTTYGEPEPLGAFNLSLDDDDSLFKIFSKQPTSRSDALRIPFMFDFTPPAAVPAPAVPAPAVPAPAVPAAAATTITVVDRPTDAGASLSGLLSITLDQPLSTTPQVIEIKGGTDGAPPTSQQYQGQSAGFLDLTALDDLTREKNGLLAFEAVPDISIIAAPGYTAFANDDGAFDIQAALITHCETMRYRVAVLDTRENYLATEALQFRNLRSSKYAAIYYPWIWVADPRPGYGGKRLKLPPSGFVAGIYARNDVEHDVFKAPANEVVRLAVDFEQRLSKAHQELLNPNGVNCFRFFEGRGLLLWGARTISDDSEWKYVSVRRYFAYLEYSIERGTQWAVFENNDDRLWAKVRQTIEDFLFNEWRRGGLIGEKPEKAFFVRCDRSTMTQNDLDNGRLICLIGVAPVKPAEFVIFRIGQWTADSPRT
jgi:uncharacterized protein